MAKMVYEILDEFEKAPTKHDKQNILRFNQSTALLFVLQAALHPNINWVIKEVPTWKPSIAPPGLGYLTIASEVSKMYLFREGNPDVSPNLTHEKLVNLFVQKLEGMEAREAQVLINAVLKNLKIKGLTYSLVKEVFPDLLP